MYDIYNPPPPHYGNQLVLNKASKAIPFSDEASKTEEEKEAERKEKAKQRRSRTNFR